MKRILLYLLLVICLNTKVISCPTDSLINVYLENDTLPNKVRIVFENNSNDSILIFSKFKNYFTETPCISGFWFHFYINDQLFGPSWGEIPQLYHTFQNGRIYIAPKNKEYIIFDLPLLIEQNDKRKYSIELEMSFKYYNISNPCMNNKYIQTERLILRKREEKKE